jgi:hypothetical protein
MPKLSSDVDICSFSPHCETNNKCTFDKLMRISSQDLSIFARSGLGLVSVNNKITGSFFGNNFRHEGIFEP